MTLRIGLSLTGMFLVSCSTSPPSAKHIGSNLEAMGPGTEESFLDVWEERTVQIGTGAGLRNSGGLRLPFSAGGRGGDFPLFIEATLMDSVLIEAGIGHFSGLADMAPDEEAAYRSRYFEHFQARDHLLIWCELRTRYAANYLNPDRWIMYIEDNEENRFEPARIMQESPLYRHEVMARPLAFHAETSEPHMEFHQQSWMLCFPGTDRTGIPVLSQTVKDLKLVFQLTDERDSRAEGTWSREEGRWRKQ